MVEIALNLSAMSKRIRYERYNPALSVKENAEALGCSEAAIKKYLRQNQMDRKYDSTYIRWKRIHDMKRQHPDYPLKRKSAELGYSINTIRKYEAMTETELDESFRDTNKVSNFDIKNTNCIKSISKSQDEILLWIMQLYNDCKPFDADLTYSKGFFYKHIPEPPHKYDKYPQISGVKNLDEVDTLSDSSFASIVIDLPFIISDIGSCSIIKDRFNFFATAKEAFETNLLMLARAKRLLCDGGILVMKTMDCASAGKQYWISDFVIQKAQEMGFEILDKFILISNLRVFTKTRTQHIARKFHSYFFVFRKH